MDTIDFRQETRIAVVLYGGVSLAIYINGVTQELLRLVRATAPNPDKPGETRFEAKGTETIYRQLGRIIGRPDHGGDEVHTRFVVDLVSGSSAGGINGIFLSKALATNRTLDELKQLWVDEGDIDALINDARSLRSLPKGFPAQQPPPSLLNSRRMYYKLWKAMDNMDRAGGVEPGLVDQIDLFVTATDLYGLVVPIRLSDERVYERRHRTAFRFSYATPEANPAEANDFSSGFTPFLAFAARATSAFPVAFEPMKLSDIDTILADPAIRSGNPDWERFYRDYLRDYGIPSVPFPERPMADGGYLDNKPFSFVIDAMLDRQANVPVDRKLIYVEPSPESPEFIHPTNRRPDAVENTWAALASLPRHETIREDLKRIRERNHEVGRLNSLLSSINAAARTVDKEGGAPGQTEDYTESRLQPGEWERMDTADLFQRFGRAYLAYHRLKVFTVIDSLSLALARRLRLNPDSAAARRLRRVVEGWVDGHYGKSAGLSAGDGAGARRKLDRYNLFLRDFDISYRLRRLRHVRRNIDRLHNSPTGSVDGREVDSIALQDELRTLAAALLIPSRTLLGVEPALAELPDLSDSPLRAELLCTSPDGGTAAGEGEPRDQKRGDARLFLGRHGPAIDQAIATIRNCYSAAFISASAGCLKALDPDEATNETARGLRTHFRSVYQDFERYDVTTFPLLHESGIGEPDKIEVFRVSPLDAAALVNEPAGDAPKLKGTALGNFGAFLDRQWRENDIMWGRLDGAERIITAVLPEAKNKALRDDLIRQAQDIILKEELADKPHIVEAARGARLSPREMLAIHRQAVKSAPDPELSARAIARSTKVIGRVFEAVAAGRRMSGRPGALVARIGQVACGLVEVAVPRSLPEMGFRHVISIILLAETALILLGFFVDGLQRLGVVALVWTAGLYVAVLLIRDHMLHSQKVAKSLVWVAGTVVFALAGLGVVTIASLGSGNLMDLLRPGTWWSEAILPRIKPSQAWIGVGTGLAGLLTLFVGGWMRQRLKRLQYPRTDRPRKPMLELESMKTVSDVDAVAGDHWHTNRRILESVQDADGWFVAGYGAMLTGLGVMFWLTGHPAAGVAAAALGIAAAVFDSVENRRIGRVLEQSLRDLSGGEKIEPNKRLACDIPTPARWKWGCALAALIAVAAALLATDNWLLRGAGLAALLAAASGPLSLILKPWRSRLIGVGMGLAMLATALLTVALLAAPDWFLAALEATSLP